jgi:archaellum component FlaC
MDMERKSVEYFIEIMNERIQFLTDSINDFENEIKAADGYAKGHFKGYNAARRSEIEFIQRRIEFLNKILEEHNNSEEAV